MSKDFLNPLKFEVIQDLPHFQGINTEKDYQARLDQFKFEVANELNIPLNKGYNGDLPSREAGRIGGNIGGKIGGHMVRDIVKASEENLSQ